MSADYVTCWNPHVTTTDGAPVAVRRGDVLPADDPRVKANPGNFVPVGSPMPQPWERAEPAAD